MIYTVALGRGIGPNVEIEGELEREDAIAAAIGGRPQPGQDVDVDDYPVTLVPEPHNAYDKNAIAVQAQGQTVGYLGRDDALRFQQPIYRIAASGAVAVAAARIRVAAKGRSGKRRIRSRITVALPEPDMMLPLNSPPKGDYNLIPWGSGLQVTKDEDHFDVLTRHVPPSGQGIMFVTLHKGTKTLKNGIERPFVEVRADGERVGEMSPATSAHFLPTVEHIETSGEIPTALAKLTGSALAVQLVLQAAKANEVPEGWLAAGSNRVPRLLPWAPTYVLAPVVAPSPLALPRAESRGATPGVGASQIAKGVVVLLILGAIATLIVLAGAIELFRRGTVGPGMALLASSVGLGWVTARVWRFGKRGRGHSRT